MVCLYILIASWYSKYTDALMQWGCILMPVLLEKTLRSDMAYMRQAETDFSQAVTMPTFILHGINPSLPGVTVHVLSAALVVWGTSGAYCIKLLPAKNSGYFNRSFLPIW